MALNTGFTRLGSDLRRSARPRDIDIGPGTPFSTLPQAPATAFSGSPGGPPNADLPAGFESLDSAFAPGGNETGIGAVGMDTADTSSGGRIGLAAALDDPMSPVNLTMGLMGLMSPSPLGLAISALRAAMNIDNTARLTAQLRAEQGPRFSAHRISEITGLPTAPQGLTPSDIDVATEAEQGAVPAPVAGQESIGLFGGGPGGIGPGATPTGGEGTAGTGGAGAGAGGPAGDASAGGPGGEALRHGGPVGPGGGTVEEGEYVIPAGGFADMLKAAHPKAMKYGMTAGLDPTDLLRLLPLLSPFLQKLLQGGGQETPEGPQQPQEGPEKQTPAPSSPQEPNRPESKGSARGQMSGLKRMVMDFHGG